MPTHNVKVSCSRIPRHALKELMLFGTLKPDFSVPLASVLHTWKINVSIQNPWSSYTNTPPSDPAFVLITEFLMSLKHYAPLITWVPARPATSHRSTTGQHLPTNPWTQLRSHPKPSFASILNTWWMTKSIQHHPNTLPSAIHTAPPSLWFSHFFCGLCLEFSKSPLCFHGVTLLRCIIYWSTTQLRILQCISITTRTKSE